MAPSTVVAEFCERLDAADPETAARRAAAWLHVCMGRTAPPIEPYHAARLVGIRDVRELALPCAGMLVPIRAGGFIARIKRSDPLARRRFTLGHEIGHALLAGPRHVQHRRPVTCAQALDVETLCDQIAAELLMPSPAFEEAAGRVRRVADVWALARQFQVSFRAVAVQMARRDIPVAVVRWRRKSLPKKPEALRVEWQSSPRGVFIPLRASAAGDSLVTAAFTSQQPARGRERLDLGTLRGEYEVDAVPWSSSRVGPAEVLSIIQLRPTPADAGEPAAWRLSSVRDAPHDQTHS